MINLFENYRQVEKDLEESLIQAGYRNRTIVLNDDGYLPNHVNSPISFFSGISENKTLKNHSPKFFNEVSVPNYWEIKGDGQKAEIFEGYKKRGKINYSEVKREHRAVKSVEWLNDSGRIRAIDLYNKYGMLYGRESYSDGLLTLTTYFNESLLEVILINHVTQSIQLNYKQKKYIFDSYNDFIIFYLQESKVNSSQIFYNSLGRPYFITEALKNKEPDKNYNHTLFWQEESADIPGNMRMILSAKGGATKTIIVQNRQEYIRIHKQINVKSKVRIDYLGYLYPIKKRNKMNKSILIVTNSDNIPYLSELARKLSDYRFNIAARTTMSDKLLSLEKLSNIYLYPTVESSELGNLISECSFYFDINYGNQVEDIIRTAYENSQLIMGFAETIHNKQYISPDNIFSKQRWEDLSNALLKVTNTARGYQTALAEQMWAAGQSSKADYKEVLK
ncbi:accessory Sec system glycosylation chaperone GtfB [Lactococcus lactis]|uniref:accessory Sec system glycosylation chaperone GtfB n=1 Tax=Lactococcus lactis TaxID=1358 RepID=UPI00289198CD|nr:accessory Sec system glycosylation chaperone GtfB [Lactococcus lactis]MDT2887977.1 accessory Sec system glycosylation chaperone GtfB [Lactococcus lactis]MDT2930757.1 accessory Sec system glycosylation chaperone GtfB [Lactococcus lactis]